jgi:pimeloyl-ACP methyl ester carboxylesterase
LASLLIIAIFLLPLKLQVQTNKKFTTSVITQNVTGIIVPNSGHWIPEEQPYFVVEHLTTFFSEK